MSESKTSNSPTKGYGLKGAKRSVHLLEEAGTSGDTTRKRKPRKKVAQRKKFYRRKQHGKENVGKTAAEALPVGVRDEDLAACMFSDDEEKEEFLQELPSSVPSGTKEMLSPEVDDYKGEDIREFLQNFSELYSSPPEIEPPSLEGSTSSSINYSLEEQSEHAETLVVSSELESISSVTTEPALDAPAATSGTEDTKEAPHAGGQVVCDDSDQCFTSAVDKPASTVLPRSESDFTPPTQVILDTVVKFKRLLPPLWQCVGDKQGAHLYRLSPKLPTAIQREVFLPYNGNAQIFVHCQPLPSAADVLQEAKSSKVELIDERCIDGFCKWGCSIARVLEQFTICIGADILELKDVWNDIANTHVDKNPYQEESYSETCRSKSCSLLLKLGKGKRCQPCGKLVRSLRQRRRTLLLKTPHRNTPNICLTYQQALEKLKIQHDEIRKKDARIAYLERHYKDLIEKEGVDVDETLSADLANILANSKLTPAQEIFFKEQFSASGKADPRAHRWHPFIIRLALHLHMTSASAYDSLRKSGVLKLPCSRTLYDYSHAIASEVGISEGILKRCKVEVGKYQRKHQTYVTVMADEMQISKNLVFRPSDGQLVGFVYLDQVDKEIQEFEAELSGEKANSKVNLASKILAFMIKGCTSSVKYVVACYPCSQLTKDMLYARTWNLISRLERSGIRVLVFVADGCAVNRAFIDMHAPITTVKSGIIFDTVNFCAEDRRPLYFMSDVAHLLKTIRNCFYNSGEGEKIVWKTIIRLYLTFRQCTFRKSYKLNSQNVFPNSYSCMKVKYAAEVLSDTVALDLEQQNWPSTTETVTFIRNVNKFFDCLNGAHSSQHIRTRNPNLAPYTDVNDPRFEWLETFLKYLEDWETQVKAKFKTAQEQEKKMLSRQTREGIEIAIRGFTGATRFLLKEGADFVNPRTFSQDHLEQHFSLHRGGGGGSTNPNASQFMSRQVSLSVQRNLGIKTRGNVSETDQTVDISDEPLAKRPRKPASRT